VSDVISGGVLGHLGPLCLALGANRPPWPTSPGPGLKPLDGSISLKFLLETRLQSVSFETLDDLLGFQVEKL